MTATEMLKLFASWASRCHERQNNLESSLSSFIKDTFDSRIFSFDEDAAYIYGVIAAKREKEGYILMRLT